MHNFDDLEFVLVRDPDVFGLIPRYLFEQIHKRNWSIENLYKFGPLFVRNPLNRIWVLVNSVNVIKGVLWITIDPIVEIVAVNILSVDREYQQVNGKLKRNQSGAIKKTAEFLRNFIAELKEKGIAELKKEIIWTTTRPRACALAGAKKYDRTIMEI